MHTVYLGYSNVLSAEEMRAYFDIDPEHQERLSKFEQVFGCDYVEPGSFEVYSPSEYENFDFDAKFFVKLLPFNPEESLVSKINFSTVESVFYVADVNVKKTYVKDIYLLGPIEVEKFEFE
ncbi:hypothetical protein [Labrenzia sp. R5_0]|jgi:hypothetical protein|uniref:hypothetical protein n=1 Tax=Labrenzia sp. R5_0 TaxID=2821108 RepID=UPI001ADA9570|nr:hypothetical protein [Labrenzia sp. R5_0]MBO9458113.1 hypothetical protein [Labrenzia sp. R5_0]